MKKSALNIQLTIINENKKINMKTENVNREQNNKKENPLDRPSAYSLIDLFKELKFGRPVTSQKYLDKCIEELHNDSHLDSGANTETIDSNLPNFKFTPPVPELPNNFSTALENGSTTERKMNIDELGNDVIKLALQYSLSGGIKDLTLREFNTLCFLIEEILRNPNKYIK